jgi:hypothetical protein
METLQMCPMVDGNAPKLENEIRKDVLAGALRDADRPHFERPFSFSETELFDGYRPFIARVGRDAPAPYTFPPLGFTARERVMPSGKHLMAVDLLAS